jgi:hypothetical protein
MEMRRIVLLLASMALTVVFGSGVTLADSPTTKEDCKNGGYAKYGFKNQGQCIKAVNHATPADTTAPQTTIDQIDTSNLATNDSVVTHFSSSESNSTFECKMWPMNELGEELNIPPWEPCSSPKTYEDLGWYSYRFYVRATDAAGNVDETPATQVFDAKVDTTPAHATITDGPADGAVIDQSSVTFSFEVTDNRGPGNIQGAGCVVTDLATGYPYRLPTDDPNGKASGEKDACSSPTTFENIPDGKYTFTVYAWDRAYNQDPDPSTRTFTVDTPPPLSDPTPPELTVTSAPPAQLASDWVWEWTGSDAGSGIARYDMFVYGEDGRLVGSWKNVTAPLQDNFGFSDETFTWVLKATDNAGNVTERTGTFRQDTTGPVATISSGPSGTTDDPTFTFEFSVNEPTSEVWCYLSPTPTNRPDAFAEQDLNCSSPKSYDLSNYGDGEYTFYVQAWDVAGNGGWAAQQTFTLDRTAP